MSDSNWQSLYDGGLGVRLSCSTVSANVAVPGATIVNQMSLTNLGNEPVFVKVGVDSNIVATTDCFPLYFGDQIILPIQAYVAAITASSTSVLLINTGNGAP